METSLVRQRVLRLIENARRSAAERRTRNDDAARVYEHFLDQVAIPVFRQVAGALKAEKFPFTVSTPSGSVRLVSDKSAENYIEISLDTAGDRPVVMGHTSRVRGRRVMESERPIAEALVSELTDEDVLAFLLREIELFLER